MDIQPNVEVKFEANDLNFEYARPSTVQITTRDLSDGSHEETPQPTYKHKWLVVQRITLAMLAESYSNNWKDKTAVFNLFHRSDLQRCGALRQAVLIAQWYDMRKWFNAADALKELQSVLSPYERARLASRPKIEKQALEIGIHLNAKEADSTNRPTLIDSRGTLGFKRKHLDINDDARTDFLPDRSDHESQTASHLQHGLPLLPKTPTKDKGKHPSFGLLTPPDSKRPKRQRDLITNKRLAPLGFRAFNSNSQGINSAEGFRAGAFVDTAIIPTTLDCESDEYRKEAIYHIGRKFDDNRKSKFVSLTKNPMRAFFILLKLGPASSIAVIDLHEADRTGNVQKAKALSYHNAFDYSANGEYLVYGGIDKNAIISVVPLSSLLANMPTIPDDADPDYDPFRFNILKSHEYIPRRQVESIHPMTFLTGQAVGSLVHALAIPPRFFQCMVWATVQDFKFHKATGSGKRGPWEHNLAFKEGAERAYHSRLSGMAMSLDVEDRARSVKEMIHTLGNSMQNQIILQDSDVSDDDVEDGPSPEEVEDWVRKTQESQTSLQYLDLQTGKWTTREEDLSHEFLEELKDMASKLIHNSAEIRGDQTGEGSMGVPESDRRYVAANLPSYNPGMDTVAVMDDGPVVTSRDHAEQDFENIDELCADVLGMHGNDVADSESAADRTEINYDFCWTGM